MAWQHISLEMPVKCFKKCCISNEVDENFNEIFWNASKEDGNARSNVQGR
jgi:hypothetical protein